MPGEVGCYAYHRGRKVLPARVVCTLKAAAATAAVLTTLGAAPDALFTPAHILLCAGLCLLYQRLTVSRSTILLAQLVSCPFRYIRAGGVGWAGLSSFYGQVVQDCPFCGKDSQKGSSGAPS